MAVIGVQRLRAILADLEKENDDLHYMSPEQSEVLFNRYLAHLQGISKETEKNRQKALRFEDSRSV
ncbi:hypothetical protein [Syntrophomonas wolfei]|jgi:hypothetical protein|uniref:Uncharacterized protein n=1 Tax=Syntrophomonas wolfei TaxID=863 RepID=A0A354YYS8_9FIRM|nr:hypothetical protein [Syntrophomonas wolfei]HBK54500.1 hypothetical protein [Syntrophomonas wolfei]